MVAGVPGTVSTAALLFAVRTEAGLSQRELAELAGTSGPTVAAYELGTKQPRLSTLARLVEAAGMRLEWRYEPKGRALQGLALTREERRSLAIHRAVAAKLVADPVGVVAHARKNLSAMRRGNEDGGADVWFVEWERRLNGPLVGVIEALVSHAEHARDLRQVTPFAGVLSDEERRAIYAADRAA
jgi:transcriptional regulator with XRE-family HTH domain